MSPRPDASESGALAGEELLALVRRVFRPRAEDRGLAFLVDVPDDVIGDRPAWRERRAMAVDWFERLREREAELGLPVSCYFYPNVHTNNGDLPESAWSWSGVGTPSDRDSLLATGVPIEFARLFDEQSIFIAVTQFSATAPLKVAARRYGFRAATMPGFSPAMIPALRLDYAEVHRRVEVLTALLDLASAAELRLRHPGGVAELTIDLRFRGAHSSSGLLHLPGTAGNLPSGEAYIVPYEGEREGEPSQTRGVLPVELDGEVVIYRFEGNRAVEVLRGGTRAEAEAQLLEREPAYGNLAELGLGVLAGLGVRPVGEVLLDEKLGLHLAFGRSDHFGGQIGPSDFSHPGAVVHIDRVYAPEAQPQILVESVDLRGESGAPVPLMRNGDYVAGLFD